MRLFFIFLFIFGTVVCADEPCSLSVEECVSAALLNNTAVARAGFKMLQTVAEKNLIRSALLPQIDLTGVIDNRNHTLDGPLTQFQDFHSNKALGISAQQGLWDFKVTWRRFKASKLLIDASEMEKDSVLLDIEEQVRTAYYCILAAEKRVEVIVHSIGILQQQLKSSEDFYNQGFVTYKDVLSIQVLIREKQKQLLQAQNELASQKMTLNQLIGLPIDSCICLQDISGTFAPFVCQEAVCFALKCRPDLLAFQLQMEALYLEKQAVQWSVAPQFFAFANGDFSTDRSQVSAGIGMRMPLYHGNRKFAEIDLVEAQIGELQTLIDEAENAIVMEVTNACMQFEELQETLRLDKEMIFLAEKNFQDAGDLYKQGMLTINDLLEAEQQLSFAKLNYYSNQYRSHTTFAHFVKVTGGFTQIPMECL